jgi:phosphate transport system protein
VVPSAHVKKSYNDKKLNRVEPVFCERAEPISKMTEMAEHTVKSFDADLSDLMRMIGELGALVEKQLKEATEGLIRHDDAHAKAALDLCQANDAMHRDIEAGVIVLIARRQPVAYDLRLIVAVWETAIELNRVGDIAKAIADRAIALSDHHPMSQPAPGLRRIARAALRRLREAVSSLVDGDASKAEKLWRSDHEIDSIYGSLCREFLTYMMADPSTTSSAVHLLFAAKSIESIGDHVTNIADAVHYLVEGRRLEAAAETPKA